MAITIVGTAENAGATASLSVTLPTLAQNDVVYLFVVHSDISITLTTPTGYTDIVATTNNSVTTNFTVYRKKMGASPDTTAVIVPSTTADIVAIAVCLRGVDRTTQEDATTTTFGWNSDANLPDSPSITTVTDNSWVISAFGLGESDTTVTAPTGYSNQVDHNYSGTSTITVGAATKQKTPAGAENPGAWSGIGTFIWWYAVSVAVRPAVARSRILNVRQSLNRAASW